MPKRLLSLLGALLARAALVAIPSVAGAGDGPGGGHYGCDHYSPYSNWGHDWWGRDGHGRYWRDFGDGNGYFDGNSYDRGCSGGYGNAAGPRGKVDRVMVAVRRLRADGTCQHLGRRGFLAIPAAAGPTDWLRASGTDHWRFPISRDLPAGRYRLHRRAFDAAGNAEKPRALHLRID
jgi:hypothetical protein